MDEFCTGHTAVCGGLRVDIEVAVPLELLPCLERVSGDLYVYGYASGDLSLTALQSVGGTFDLYWWDAEAFTFSAPLLSNVGGDVLFYSWAARVFVRRWCRRCGRTASAGHDRQHRWDPHLPGSGPAEPRQDRWRSQRGLGVRLERVHLSTSTHCGHAEATRPGDGAGSLPRCPDARLAGGIDQYDASYGPLDLDCLQQVEGSVSLTTGG